MSKLAPIGAVILFFFGYLQYRRAESWKRTEFVANLYKEFSKNTRCETAMCLLAGDRRTLFYEDSEKLVPYSYDYDVLCEALLTKQRPLDERQHHIRDSLEEFFVYIEQFERAIQNKLVSQADVYPYFGYWIGLLKNDKSIKTCMREDARNAVMNHMTRGEFDDAQSFFFQRKWQARVSWKQWLSQIVKRATVSR